MMTNKDINCGIPLGLICQSWPNLLILTVLGALIGFGIASMVTPKWEVSALIEGGYVGGTRAVASSVRSEDATLILKRLRSPQAMIGVMKKIGYEVTKKNMKKMIADASFSLAGNYVELRVRAESQEKAVQITNAFLEEVQNQEQAILNQEQAILNDETQALRNYMSISERQHNGVASAIQRDASLMDLTESLQSPRIFPARFITDVSGLPWPVFPDPALFSILGALVGFSVAAVRAFSKHTQK